MTVSPASVTSDLYRLHRMHPVVFSLCVSSLVLLVILLANMQPYDRMARGVVIAGWFILVGGSAVGIELLLEKRRRILYRYLATHNPAELARTDFDFLFRALRLRAIFKKHPQDEDLVYAQYLHYYAEHHAAWALKGAARHVADWMWTFRAHFPHIDATADMSWLARAAGRASSLK